MDWLDHDDCDDESVLHVPRSEDYQVGELGRSFLDNDDDGE